MKLPNVNPEISENEEEDQQERGASKKKYLPNVADERRFRYFHALNFLESYLAFEQAKFFHPGTCDDSTPPLECVRRISRDYFIIIFFEPYGSAIE